MPAAALSLEVPEGAPPALGGRPEWVRAWFMQWVLAALDAGVVIRAIVQVGAVIVELGSTVHEADATGHIGHRAAVLTVLSR